MSENSFPIEGSCCLKPNELEVKRYNFVASKNNLENKKTKENIALYLKTKGTVAPGELEISQEKKEQINATKGIILKFIKDKFGVIATSRMPDNSKIHIYNETNFKDVAVEHNLPSYVVALNDRHDNIVVKHNQVAEIDLGNIQHELIHSCSNQIYDFKIDTEGTVHVKRNINGYSNENTGTFTVLNEALVEITNLEIMAEYWKNDPNLKQLSIKNYHPGNQWHIIVFDEIIKKVANEEGCDYKKILRELQEGMFKGEMNKLRILTKHLGIENMKKLATVKDNFVELCQLANELGLQNAQEKLNKIHNGNFVNVLEKISSDIQTTESWVYKNITIPSSKFL